jgi:molybdopterin-guanine dinucleotide biosynthesis protein A
VCRMLVGIFVGGASRRMGTAKGLLRVDGRPLLARLLAIAPYPVVIVGDHAPYASLVEGLETLADQPAGIGPLGGLRALLLHERGPAIAIACDMPFIERVDLVALAEDESDAPIVAARRDHFEPFFARYDAERVLPAIDDAIARGEHSLQRLFERLEVAPFTPVTAHALEDWDTPDDITRAGSSRG